MGFVIGYLEKNNFTQCFLAPLHWIPICVTKKIFYGLSNEVYWFENFVYG